MQRHDKAENKPTINDVNTMTFAGRNAHYDEESYEFSNDEALRQAYLDRMHSEKNKQKASEEASEEVMANGLTSESFQAVIQSATENKNIGRVIVGAQDTHSKKTHLTVRKNSSLSSQQDDGFSSKENIHVVDNAASSTVNSLVMQILREIKEKRIPIQQLVFAMHDAHITKTTHYGVDGNNALNEHALISQLEHYFQRLEDHFKQQNFQPPSGLNQADLLQASCILRQHYCSEEEAYIPLDLNKNSHKVRVDQLFVNLAIIEEAVMQRHEVEPPSDMPSENIPRDTTTSTASNLRRRPRRLHDGLGHIEFSENIDAEKTLIKPENLFEPRQATQNRIPKSIFLLGRAGIGKTTLCRYQAYRWATNTLWQDQFNWVFSFRLKEIAHRYDSKSECTLPKLLHNEYFAKLGWTEEKSTRFWQLLLEQPQKVLFLLDGYDEVSHQHHNVCDRLVNVNEALRDTTGQAIRFSVIISSRPYARLFKNIDLVLENIGFIDDDIPQFVDRYFSTKTAEATEVKTWLNQKPRIKQLCRVPIHLALLCSTLDGDFLKYDFVMTELYQRLTIKLLQRYIEEKIIPHEAELSKVDGLDYEKILTDFDVTYHLTDHSSQIKYKQYICTALNFFEELAFMGLRLGNIIIPGKCEKRNSNTKDTHGKQLLPRSFQELYQKYKDIPFWGDKGLEELLTAGFIKLIYPSAEQIDAKQVSQRLDSSECSCYFLHLSLQEYLAGRYLARHLTNNTELTQTLKDTFVARYKYDPTYQLAWIYGAGSLAQSPARLEQYIITLLEPPRDLFGVYELELLVRCGEEAKWPNTALMHALLGHLGEWVVQIRGFDVKKDAGARQLLNHLAELFMQCPQAMAKVHYQKKRGLFFFLSNQASRKYNFEMFFKIILKLWDVSFLLFGLTFIPVVIAVYILFGYRVLNFEPPRFLLDQIKGNILRPYIFPIIGTVNVIFFLPFVRAYYSQRYQWLIFLQQFVFQDRSLVNKLIQAMALSKAEVREQIAVVYLIASFSKHIQPIVNVMLLVQWQQESNMDILYLLTVALIKHAPNDKEAVYARGVFLNRVLMALWKTEYFSQVFYFELTRLDYPPSVLNKAQNLLDYLILYFRYTTDSSIEKQNKLVEHFCFYFLHYFLNQENFSPEILLLLDNLRCIVQWQAEQYRQHAELNDITFAYSGLLIICETRLESVRGDIGLNELDTLTGLYNKENFFYYIHCLFPDFLSKDSQLIEDDLSMSDIIFSLIRLKNNEYKFRQYVINFAYYTSEFKSSNFLIPNSNTTNYESAQRSVTKYKKFSDLTYKEIPGDGNCLYNAVGLHIGQDAQSIRNIVAANLAHNRANYEQFVNGILRQNQTFESYIHGIRSGEWGDDIELSILMRLLDRAILVIRPDGSINNLNEVDTYSGDPIFVFYNGYNHYNAFIRDSSQLTGRQILEELIQLGEELRRQNLEQLIQLNKRTRIISLSSANEIHNASSDRSDLYIEKIERQLNVQQLSIVLTTLADINMHCLSSQYYDRLTVALLGCADQALKRLVYSLILPSYTFTGLMLLLNYFTKENLASNPLTLLIGFLNTIFIGYFAFYQYFPRWLSNYFSASHDWSGMIALRRCYWGLLYWLTTTPLIVAFVDCLFALPMFFWILCGLMVSILYYFSFNANYRNYWVELHKYVEKYGGFLYSLSQHYVRPLIICFIELIAILTIVSKLLEETLLFSHILVHYPCYWDSGSQLVFIIQLRRNLLNHMTAIWQNSETKEFVWYQGREEISFVCDHPRSLLHSLDHIRLSNFNYSPDVQKMAALEKETMTTNEEEWLHQDVFETPPTFNIQAPSQIHPHFIERQSPYTRLATMVSNFWRRNIKQQAIDEERELLLSKEV